MNFRDFLPKLGLIVSIISSLASAVWILHEWNKPTPVLMAQVSDNIFYTPPQYYLSMLQYSKEINWQKVYNSMSDVNDPAYTGVKERVASDIINTMRIPFLPPFENGLEDYRTQVFIYIENNGEAISKDVYVDFPSKVLLMVKDDKGDTSHEDNLISRYKIPSIRQGGHYKLWAWVKNDDNFNKYKVKIGSEDQIANIEIGETYFGKTGKVINLIQENMTFFVMCLSFILFIFILCLFVVISQFFDEK